MIDDLYTYLREFFEMVRRKEEKAILNKKRANRREKVSPAELASQIFHAIQEDEGYLLRSYHVNFLDANKPFDTYDIPVEGTPEAFRGDMFTAHGVRFKKGKKELTLIDTKNEAQDELLILLVHAGVRGLVRIPRESAEVYRVLGKYEKFVHERDKRVRYLIEQRTADEDIQDKIYQALMPMILQHN
jgi:hypothetical protein